MRKTKLLILLLIVVCIIIEGVYVLCDEVIQSKSFKIKFKSMEEVASIIEPLLSQKGTMTLQPKARTIIISDAVQNLSEIESTINDFDVPSPAVKMFFKLIYAEKKERSEPVKNVPDYVLKMRNIFQYTDYEVIDEFLLESVEGDEPSFQMGKDYKIKFKISYISSKKGLIQLKNFSIDKVEKGVKKEIVYKNLLTTSINLRDKETVILGATKLEESPKALFIALTGQLKK